MRKLYASLSTLFFILIFVQSSYATHVMGGDLNYYHLGGNQYLVELTLYRDCTGAILGNTVISRIVSDCGDDLAITLELDTTTGKEVSPLCPSEILNSSCNGGSLPGVERYVYTGITTLPSNCSRWVFSYDICCRNAAITNLVDAGSDLFYIEAILEDAAINNNSPKFSALGTPYICDNRLYNYNHSAFDIDGDSLVFSLIQPRENVATPIPYEAGYSIATPIQPSVTFNTSNGQMTVTPNANQVAVVSVKVEEYRNGVLIGSTMRDIQIVVRNCNNDAPVIDTVFSNVSGGIQLGANSFEMCTGETLNFTASVVDPDGDNISDFTLTPSAIFSTASITYNDFGDSATIDFTWTAGPNDAGRHILSLFAEDDKCPIAGNVSLPVSVDVKQGLDAGPDLIYCPGGVPPQINTLGGSVFSWTSISGPPAATSLSCLNCPDPFSTPSASTVYEVTSDITRCKNVDTVEVDVVSPIFIDISDPDLCLGDSATFTVNVNPSEGPHHFEWYRDNIFLDSSGSSYSTVPNSGIYYRARVEGGNGCIMEDSAQVNFIGERIELDIREDTLACFGDTIYMNPSYVRPIIDCGIQSAGTCSGFIDTVSTGESDALSAFAGIFLGGNFGKFQCIYPAEYLKDQGLKAGFINSIGFFVQQKNSSNPYENFTIKMKCTDDSLFLGTIYNVGLTTVYNGASVQTNAGWTTFALDSEFAWNGRSNIMVEICYENSGFLDEDIIIMDELNSPSQTYSLSAPGFSGPLCNEINPLFIFPTNTLPVTKWGVCNERSSTEFFSWSSTGSLQSPSDFNPYIVVDGTSNSTMSLHIGNPACGDTESNIVSINNSVTAEIVGDTCAGPAQLNAMVTGNPLPAELNCGLDSASSCSTKDTLYIGKKDLNNVASNPFMAGQYDARYQFLYNELTLKNFGINDDKVITGIYVDIIAKNSTVSYDNFSIKIGCLDDFELVAADGWVPTQEVFYSSSYNTTTGLNYFPFSKPFNYDGSSGIVLDFCFDNSGRDLDDEIFTTFTNRPSTISYINNTSDAVGCTPDPVNTRSSYLDVTFEYCDPPLDTFSYVWTPAASLNNPFIQNPVATPSGDQQYVVTVTGGQCEATDTVFLPQCPPLSLDFLAAEIYTSIGGKPELTWALSEPYDDQGTYSILRAQREGSFEEVGQIPFGNGSYRFEDVGAHERTKYYYKIQAEVNGETVRSRVLEWKGDTEIIEVFPNPARGVLNVNIGDTGASILELYSLSGKLVNTYLLNTGDNQINIESLRSGVYYYRISGSAVLSGKIMKD